MTTDDPNGPVEPITFVGTEAAQARIAQLNARWGSTRPLSILLSGVVGSQAYGLAGPDSDVDRLGVYAAPTVKFHGLYPPLGRMATIVEHEPSDTTYHEALKFVTLCLNGNPTVTELLWLNEYEVITHLGRQLLSLRSAFLTRERVREAYLGYARAQFHRLRDTGQFQSKMRKRAAKHGRHLLRLLDQGFELYSTGFLTIKVKNPEWYITQGELIAEEPANAQVFLTEAEEKFNSVTSPLPEHADVDTIERWLQRVRIAHLPRPQHG